MREADASARKLPPSDRAFAVAIALATLRRLGEIDALLDIYLRKEPPAHVRDILRAGIAQLLFLKTPAHAVVHVAVEQVAGNAKTKPLRSLVNAVLRNCIREGESHLGGLDSPICNVPAPLLKSWRQAYGIERTGKIAAAHCSEPPLDLQFRNRDEGKLWCKKFAGISLPAGAVRLRESRNIPELEGYAQGAWWVQDVAASLPVRLLGDVSGKRVIELCAAPGGKSAQLCASGAKVVAVDRSAARLDVLRDNLKRLQLRADEIIEADVLAWEPQAPAHFVLLDAPCSATGTLRRHPDVVRRKGRGWEPDGKYLVRLAALQEKLLARAGGMVEAGGVLVYSVCSLQKEESEERVEAFLREHRDFTRETVNADCLDGLEECISPEGDLRTLPCHLEAFGGMDGFYAARLRRRG